VQIGPSVKDRLTAYQSKLQQKKQISTLVDQQNEFLIQSSSIINQENNDESLSK
jgi:hypothetical protein